MMRQAGGADPGGFFAWASRLRRTPAAAHGQPVVRTATRSSGALPQQPLPLSAEASALLLSAAGPTSDERLLRLLEQPLDWTRFCRLALHQGALPTAYQRLRGLASPEIAEDLTRAMSALAAIAEFRQIHLERRLAQVSALLSSHDVPVLYLKGAALSLRLGSSFACRPMQDLDLLLRPGDTARAQELLTREGWRSRALPNNASFYEGHQHLAPLGDPAVAGLSIELHTDICLPGHPFALTADRLFASAREARANEVAVLIPSDEHLILHLCIHFAWSHMLRHGAWRAFRDLHALAEAGALEWEALPEQTAAARARSCSFWTLLLARNCSALSVPDDVLHALRPRMTHRSLGALERHFAAHLVPSEVYCPSVRLSKWLWSWGIQPEREGHAAVRPWQRGELAREAFGARLEPDLAEKARLQAKNLGAWKRFLGLLLRG